MKKFAIACALVAATSSSALAGSMTDPVIEAPVIIEDAASSSSGTTMVALLALVLAIPLLD